MMARIKSWLFGIAVAVLPSLALAQSAILQGGTFTPGHVPVYVGSGSSISVVQDSGSAAGGGPGVGLSEINITARGTGNAPFAAQGTGPLGTIACLYDAPITNSTGYHYFCLSPNAQGGGLIAYGAGGAASNLPLQISVNGTLYPFPFTVSSTMLGPATTVVGDVVVWNSTNGTLTKDVSLPTLCASNLFGSAVAGCVPLSGGGTTNFLRADGTWAVPSLGSGSTGQILISQTSPPATWNSVSGDATLAATGAITIANSAITNAKLANSAAFTLKGNATGSSAAPTDFTIGGLTNKATPAIGDLLLIQDQSAAGALKQVTVGSVLSGFAVTSLNGLSGALSVSAGTGISVGVAGSTITVNNTVTNQPLCGSSGLVVTVTSNTLLTITARELVTTNSSTGLTLNRTNVSVTVNTATGNVTSTINGMDGEVPGTSQWLYLWATDNGSAAGGLLSTSSTAPTLPSGYSYKCYLGAVRVDGSSFLLRTIQRGNRAHYVVTAATNTATLPTVHTTGALSFWTAQSMTAFVPATATTAWLACFAQVFSSQSAGVAANASYPAGTGGGVQFFALGVTATATDIASTVPIVFEAAQNIYLGDAAGSGLFLVSADGWIDAVNAN